jgi:putative glutamine amidotransferase
MSVRIAVPVPSSDAEYNQRSFAPYLAALEAAGAVPVVVLADATQVEIARILAGTQGVLLPGSRFDVEPERYNEPREPECGPADPVRTAIDELLLQDAFNLRKPVLAICHGCQSLNVWCGGSLIQDLKTGVNHRAGREVVDAHPIQIAPGTWLATMAGATDERVNSTHHQAIRAAGDRLRVAAVSALDGVVEAVELASEEHFVVAVQWHPERTYGAKAFSRGIFAAFMSAASRWQEQAQEEGGGDGR